MWDAEVGKSPFNLKEKINDDAAVFDLIVDSLTWQ